MSETVTLKYAVTVDGSEVTELALRRPTVSDMLMADKAKGSDAEKEVKMFSNLAEVSPEAISALDLADYAQLQEVYRGFLS